MVPSKEKGSQAPGCPSDQEETPPAAQRGWGKIFTKLKINIFFPDTVSGHVFLPLVLVSFSDFTPNPHPRASGLQEMEEPLKDVQVMLPEKSGVKVDSNFITEKKKTNKA